MIQRYEEFLESRKNPCWKGYKQIGTKLKRGRKVPNCVSVNEQESAPAQFDRGEFYLDYYTNLSPNDFKLSRFGNSIMIEIPGPSQL